MRGEIVSRPPTKEWNENHGKVQWTKSDKKPVKETGGKKTYTYGTKK